MIRYKNSSKWTDKELPDAEQMSYKGGGHATFVTVDRPDSKLLTCYQHIGSGFKLNGAVPFYYY